MLSQKISIDKILKISSPQEFNEFAIVVFRYQYINNPVYKKYVDLLGVNVDLVKEITKIPFLPIEFFRSQQVITGTRKVETIFTSSGTTSENPGKHYVPDLSVYDKSMLKGFTRFYGNPKDYIFLALLPSYLEREGSSLVYMVNQLINLSGSKLSGFYLNDLDALVKALEITKTAGKKVILLGVTYALLDLIENYTIDYPELIVMETGGMKGKRKEITRPELHSILKKGFNVNSIHSEYGMTELLSQAYSKEKGIFYCPDWMKIVLRDTNDPLTPSHSNTGGINVIDLANINSCAFIATQDLGRMHDDGGFEVLGRFDNAAIRGCNLLIA